jgi:predicted PurR-regulated permease PerM
MRYRRSLSLSQIGPLGYYLGLMTNTKVVRFSYIFMFLAIVSVAFFHLATPFLTILFSVMALRLLTFNGRKGVAVLIFLILVISISYGAGFYVRESLSSLPRIAESVIPKVLEYADDWGLTLPFSDLVTLKALASSGIKQQATDVAKFGIVATREVVVMIIALVIAIGIFTNGKIDLSEGSYVISNNLYSCLTKELSERFVTLYRSFVTVMGAQLIIASINTTFTAIFVLLVKLNFAKSVIVITFACGLLPIIGNLISNSIIVGIALTQSPQLAVASLIFLVVLHKGEYFLNSRIIGGRIRNPMWLTLLGLVIGETVMGIPGMIFAPVILHYLKSEASQIEVS